VGIQLPTSMRSELALANNPGNLGKRLAVKGDVMKYCGGPGVKNLTDKVFDGSGDTPVTPPVTGGGDGSETSPFVCSQVIAANPSSTTEAPAGYAGVWVQGYIVGYMPTGGSSTTLSGTVFAADANAATTNLVIGPTADCKDASLCVGVQLPASMRADLALANQPSNLGKLLKIKGDVMKYCGGPGVKNLTANVLEGASEPGPGVEPSGEGTAASPYNVTKALAVASALSASDEVAAYAKGTIASITELSTSFGNATYVITDGSAKLQVYRGYWFNGDKFTSESQLAVGAEVVVSGKLVNYMGNTPQFTTGSMIVSYNGSTGGDTPTPPDTPDDPVTPPAGEDGVINHDAFTGVAGDATVTAGGYTFTFAKNGGATNPQDYTADMRLYAKNSLQIQGGRMTKIVFTLGSVKTRYTSFTPSTGAIEPAQAEGDTTITWVGDATDVTFTVGDTALYGAEAGKPGQIRFTKIEITAAE
ncbi:MAG: OB-fold nucleic acid binding domain-containing protein, partial [Muribaculaceae bacterium]|nr:OB-fold nucleic acid binding domain-containing protein [Muribaculaceae bacterium]